MLRSFEESAARRAEKRAELNAARLTRQAREDQEARDRARRRAEEEEAERRRMRQQTVHHAQPIRYYRGAPAAPGGGANAGRRVGPLGASTVVDSPRK